MAADKLIGVYPPLIEIQDVVKGNVYTSRITVKNLDVSAPHTVRVKGPATKWFTAQGINQTHRLAPGITAIVEVRLDTSEATSERDYHDALLVRTDLGDVEVPIKACTPRGQLQLQGSLDFGIVPLDSTVEQQLVLSNAGSKPATFKLQWERDQATTFSPAEGTVAAGGSINITAKLLAQEVRSINGELKIAWTSPDCPGGPGSAAYSFGATIVPQSYQLVEPGGSSAVTKVEFGQLYYGEASSREVVLVNTGPAEAKFELSFGAASDMQALAGDGSNSAGDGIANFLAVARVRAKALECKDHIVDVAPLNGVIPPYGHTTLQLTFSPKLALSQRGFTSKSLLPEQQSNSYNYLVQITVTGTCTSCCGGAATATLLSKALRLSVAGEGLAAAVQVQPQVLHFGRVPCHEWADQLVQVQNMSLRSVLVVVDKASPNFQVEPAELELEANTTENVLVRYLPKALGKHETQVKFHVISSKSRNARQPLVLSSTFVAVSGSSVVMSIKRPLPGGPDAIPENFTKQRKYVDEADAAVADLIAGKTFRRPKIWEPAINAWTLDGIGPEDKYGVMKEVHMSRVKHADQYTTFIRAGRTAKAQGYLTRKEGDESDVDLGMAPYRGLKLPAPKTTISVDPLWTAQQTQQAGPTIKRAPADNMLATIPAYKQQPETPAERVAVSRPLENTQINSLVVGPRMLDYGKLSPSSTGMQCFVVTNPLSEPIHVVMDLMGMQDVRCTGPVSQVIPAGATAKWPLELRCHDVRSIRQKLDYCINGCHFYTVDLVADIVPVTLKLNNTELHFAFGIDDWDASVSKFLMMENPNSFPAEFSWEIDSSVFSVMPESGTVKPHGSLEVVVSWTPKLGGHSPQAKGGKSGQAAAAEAATTAGGAALPSGTQGGAVRKVPAASTGGAPRSSGGARSQGGAAAESQTSATMVLRLKGGSDSPQKVQLTGELPAGALKFKEKEVNIGGVSVGARQETMVRLTNMGANDAAYRVSPNSSSCLSLSVPKGCVPSGSCTYLWMRFEVDAPGHWSATLELEVQGSKPLKLPVKAEGIVPNVVLLEDGLMFPDTFIGSSNRLSITLHNTAPVPATLLADFTCYPDFQLLLSRDAWASAGYDACPVQKIGANGEMSTMGSKRVSRRSSRMASSSNMRVARPSSGYRFIIKLKPSSQLPMMLSFQPSKPHLHEFPAPFSLENGLSAATVSHLLQGAGAPTRANASLAGGPGGLSRAGSNASAVADVQDLIPEETAEGEEQQPEPPAEEQQQQKEQLRVPVHALGVQPQLVLTKTLVEFGSKIAFRSHQRNVPYSHALYVRNNTESALKVHFGPPTSDKQAGCLGVFKLEGAEDTTLEPEEGMDIQVLFSPTDSRLYEARIPVYTEGNVHTPHLYLDVNGTGVFAKLTFDVPEVLLPPVPLGITTSATFQVVNQGYDNLELQTRLPPDTARLPLVLDFPEGNLIGLAKEKLPVTVTFTSSRPISFSTTLDFLDEEGRCFKLPISGSVDNSLLTLQPFMQANSQNLHVVVSEAGTLILKEVEGGYDITQENALGPIHTSPSVTKYLSAICARGWPADVRTVLMASKGRLLQELVETLSGRPMPVRIPKAATNKLESVQSLLVLYDTILTYLKTSGALLAPVQPEMLLEQADFDTLMDARTAAAAGNDEEEEALDRWSALEEGFDMRSAQAWNTVLNQVLRVFVLGRITPEALRQLVQQQGGGRRHDRTSAGGGPAALNSSGRSMTTSPTMKQSSHVQEGSPATGQDAAKTSLLPKPGQTPRGGAGSPSAEKGAGGKETSAGPAGRAGSSSRQAAAAAAEAADAEAGPVEEVVPSTAAGVSLDDQVLSGSNLYSTPECCLLAWLSHNLAVAFPQLTRTLRNFDVDLSDGIALFSLLLNYWPPLARHKGRLHQFPADTRQCRENCELLLGLMQDLKLSYECTSADLEEPDAQDMIMLVTYLFNTLPQLQPRTTVDLQSRLGDAQIRDVELSLPNRRGVTYVARIDGPSCFSVEHTVVRVDPGRPCNLSVKFTPITSKPQQGRLVLMAKREPVPQEGPAAKDHTTLSAALAPGAMVFVLSGAVLTQQPLKRVDVTTPLYEMAMFDVTVTNPYPTDCEFTIVVKHTAADSQHQQQPAAGAKGQAATSKAAPAARSAAASKDSGTQIKGPSANQHPEPFGVDRQRLRLRAGTSEKLKGSYLPFTHGSHRALIILSDTECGEFCYELCGTADHPAPFLDQKALVPLEGLQHVEIPLNYINHQLDNARRLYAEKHPLGKEKEQLVKVRSDIGSLDKDRGERVLEYAVACSSRLINCPATITLKTPAVGGPGAGGAADSSRAAAADRATKGGARASPAAAISSSGSNVLKLSLRPVGTGVYPAQLVLTSNWDVRVILVEVTAQCMGQAVVLELESAARQSVVQEIPAVNTHDAPITVQAQLKGVGYSGPKDLALPPGATGQYPLTFTPPGMGTYQGVLELVFPHTGEKNVYTLLGKGGEPLAQGHIPVDCQARVPQIKRIAVPNFLGSTPALFTVMSDLECLSGPETFTCNSTRGDSYTFNVNPVRSGSFQGTLSFVAPDGQYVWYSVEVRATEPVETGTIIARCPVHKAMAIFIDLTNPLDKAVTFKASFSVPELVGPARCQVPANSTATYECYYAPLLLGKSHGVVRLINDEVGEFWWKVDMEAAEGGQLELPPLSAAFGRSADLVVPIANPLETAAVFNLSVKSTASEGGRSARATASGRCFTVQPQQLKLDAYASADCVLTYRPCQLGEVERGIFRVESDTAGSLLYDVAGKGELPCEAETCKMTAALNVPVEHQLKWTNPCSTPATLEVALLSAETLGSFELLLAGKRQDAAAAAAVAPKGAAAAAAGGGKLPRTTSSPVSSRPTSGGEKTLLEKLQEAAAGVGGRASGLTGPLLPPLLDSVIVTVPAGESLDIPVAFCPTLLQQYKAQVAVLLASPAVPAPVPLVWRYAIAGEAHADTQGLSFSFKGKARQPVEDVLMVPLPGLGAVEPGTTFSYEIVPPVQHAAALAPALQVELLDSAPAHYTPSEGTFPTFSRKASDRAARRHNSSSAAAAMMAHSQALRCRVVFKPLKALNATAQLVVTRSTGGAWSYDLHLQATPPDVDGVIQLEAHMGCTAEVPLPLYASGNTPQEFTADFTPETPLCFDVRPAKGLLPPAPALGTAAAAAAAAAGSSAAITVLFTSKELGKVAAGRLVVVTPDSQYTYELQGKQPAYVPPTAANRASGSYVTATTASAAAKGLGLGLKKGANSSSTAAAASATPTAANRSATSSSSKAAAPRVASAQQPTGAAAARTSGGGSRVSSGGGSGAAGTSRQVDAAASSSNGLTRRASGTGSSSQTAASGVAAHPHRNFVVSNIRKVHGTPAAVPRSSMPGARSSAAGSRSSVGGAVRRSTPGKAGEASEENTTAS